MAIVGLCLGIVYLISNMYMNGHLGSLQNVQVSNTPVVQPTQPIETKQISTSISVKLISVTPEKYEYVMRVTNTSGKYIKAYKGYGCIRDAFGKVCEPCRNIEKFEPLKSGEHFDITTMYIGDDLIGLMGQIKQFDSVHIDTYDTTVLFNN